MIYQVNIKFQKPKAFIMEFLFSSVLRMPKDEVSLIQESKIDFW